jgi:hypothetical protein
MVIEYERIIAACPLGSFIFSYWNYLAALMATILPSVTFGHIAEVLDTGELSKASTQSVLNCIDSLSMN